MLVMTVQENEFVMIGKDIRVQYVKDETSKSIRLGIDAPRSLDIARSKVYEKLLREDPNADPKELEEIKAKRKSGIIEMQKKKRRIAQNG